MGATFSIITNDLIQQLELLKDIVPSYPTIRILENIKLEGDGRQLQITASDNETTIITKCKYKGDEFATVLPLIPLTKVLSICGKKIEITLNDRSCIIKSENHECVIPTFDSNEYPKYDFEDDPKMNTPLYPDFIKELKKAADFVSKDELRRPMTRVLLDVKGTFIKIVSTDAHAMFFAQFEITDDIEEKVLVPFKGLQYLKSCDGMMSLFNNHLHFKFDDLLIQIRIDNESKYPDYETVIPDPNNYIGKIGFNKLLFVDAVKKVMELQYHTSSYSDSHIIVELVSSKLSISSNDNEDEMRFQIWIDGTGSGEYKPFKIDYKRLYPLLNSIDGDFIYMNFSEGEKGIIVSCHGQKRLIMPVRI